MNTNAGNLKKGDFIYYQDAIWQVQKADFYSPGKGSALMKTKIKNLTSGKNIDYTFKSGESVQTVEVESIEMQYLYKDQEYLYFMNQRNFNQYQVALSVVGESAQFLKEGANYFVYLQDDRPLNVRPPLSVRMKIIETEDAVKGDTATSARKSAKLESGIIIMVPLFIKKGETVVVNPETGEYVERVKS